MIPLRDESRRLAHSPVITTLIIAVNGLVFMLELTGGDAFVTQWSVLPVDILAGRRWVTLLTAMFMHGSWSHILGNMIFLWAFGPAIEDVMNPWRYTAFYLIGGVASMLVQIFAWPGSTVPLLGASGAIAAVMGAFLVTYPGDRIRTVLFFGLFFRVAFIPSALLIGFWFIMQLFSLGAVSESQGGGVAYLAHIGGVVFGAVSVRIFEDPRRTSFRRERNDFREPW